MTASIASVTPLGDSALVFGIGGSDAVDVAAHAATTLRAAGVRGVLDAIAAYETVAVYFDPLTAERDVIERAVRRAASAGIAPTPPRHIEIPVRYDGPDLESVAALTGMTAQAVVAAHSAHEYRVLAVGFVPGFAYLGALPPELRVPRRAVPRTRVPAGSVAIAADQTAVYPLETPGGWHLIGRTDVTMFEPARDPPGLLAVGSLVRFVAE